MVRGSTPNPTPRNDHLRVTTCQITDRREWPPADGYNVLALGKGETVTRAVPVPSVHTVHQLWFNENHQNAIARRLWMHSLGDTRSKRGARSPTEPIERGNRGVPQLTFFIHTSGPGLKLQGNARDGSGNEEGVLRFLGRGGGVVVGAP